MNPGDAAPPLVHTQNAPHPSLGRVRPAPVKYAPRVAAGPANNVGQRSGQGEPNTIAISTRVVALIARTVRRVVPEARKFNTVPFAHLTVTTRAPGFALGVEPAAVAQRVGEVGG